MQFTIRAIHQKCAALKLLLFITFLALAIVSCSREEPEDILSDKADLISFVLSKAENPSLSTDLQGIRNRNVFYMTVPEGVDLTNLKPSLLVSPGATVRINNVPVTSSGSNPTASDSGSDPLASSGSNPTASDSGSDPLASSGSNPTASDSGSDPLASSSHYYPPATRSMPAVDFSGVVTVEVTAENGKALQYKLLVKNGRQEFDNLIYQCMAKYDIPGISFAFSKNEEIAYCSGLGFAITETEERTTPGHLFRLASISKQFTTLCILKLYEAGKLTLDDRVFGTGGILEQEYGNVTPRAAAVTIRHLLQHTSGWGSDPDPMFSSAFTGQTLDQRIRYMLGTTQAEPGTVFTYSNMGFGILGEVIKKVSGQPYEEYLKAVLSEAGITDIHVGKDRAGRRPNEVVYYSQNGYNGYANPMDVIAAAGGVIASTEQMLQLLFHIDGRPIVPDIIQPATRIQMLTPSAIYPRYALGWRRGHKFFPDAAYHSGNLAGTATMWVMGSSET
ncbi:MAG TPA: serine hydrolase, partial [Bacteroidales bacterium]|nr:serine hydrolase [Bacteroidales bacterium]